MTSENHKEEYLSYSVGLNPLHLFTHILEEQKEDNGGTEEEKEEATDSDSDRDSDTEEIIFDDTSQVKQEDTEETINICNKTVLIPPSPNNNSVTNVNILQPMPPLSVWIQDPTRNQQW